MYISFCKMYNLFVRQNRDNKDREFFHEPIGEECTFICETQIDGDACSIP